MKTLDFKAAATAVMDKAVAAVKAAVSRPASRSRNRDAAEELNRRAGINAHGAALRQAREDAALGRRRGWIEARPDWLGRGR